MTVISCNENVIVIMFLTDKGHTVVWNKCHVFINVLLVSRKCHRSLRGHLQLRMTIFCIHCIHRTDGLITAHRVDILG